MVLVDANVLLDVLTNDPVWAAWSIETLSRVSPERLAINPIIFAEIAPAFRSVTEHANALTDWPVEMLTLPYEAAWPAAFAFAAYRQRGELAPRHCRTFSSARMPRLQASSC